MHEAKTHLSALLEAVEKGEDVVIARAGRPVARLIPTTPTPTPQRRSGAWRGRVVIADDFDETPHDVVRSFETDAP